MERLRKEGVWESQDLNLSQLGIHIQEAKMQMVGEKLLFVEGVEVLVFVFFFEAVKKEWNIYYFLYKNHEIILFCCL